MLSLSESFDICFELPTNIHIREWPTLFMNGLIHSALVVNEIAVWNYRSWNAVCRSLAEARTRRSAEVSVASFKEKDVYRLDGPADESSEG